MSGRGAIVSDPDEVAIAGITMTNSSNVEIPAVHPIHFDPSAAFGLARDFAVAVKAELNVPIGLIPCAVGGSAIASWAPGTGANYNAAVARINAALALGGQIGGILWHQGEADIGSGTWEASHDAIVAALRALYGSDVPWINGDLGDFYVGSGDVVRVAIRETFERLTKASTALSTDLTHIGDDTHFDRSSLITFGARYATEYLRVIERLAPAAPGNLAIASGDEQATATFDEVATATSYRVYYSTSSPVTTSDSYVEESDTDITITGLVNNTRYFVAVGAVNGAGVGSLSAQTTVLVGNDGSMQLTASSSQDAYVVDADQAFSGSEAVLRFRVRFDSLPGVGLLMAFATKNKVATGERCFAFDLQNIAGVYNVRMGIGSTGAASGFVTLSWQTALAIDTNYEFEFRLDGSGADVYERCRFLLDGLDQGDADSTSGTGTATSIYTGAPVTQEVFIGNQEDATRYLDGRIDHVEWYSDLAETTLVALYPLNDDGGGGLDLNDYSGNAYHLTGNNSPTLGSPL